MKRLLTIGEAAEALGVTTTTLRNWDKSGVLHPDERTRGETADIGLSHCVTSNHRQASQRIEKPLPTPVYLHTTRSRTWCVRCRFWRTIARQKAFSMRLSKTSVLA